MSILVSTVWHSGTNSLINQLGFDPKQYQDKDEKNGLKVFHCCDDATTLAKSGKYNVYTTQRSPADVGKSWGKRRNRFRDDVWKTQWENYVKILPLATVVPVEEMSERLNASNESSRFTVPQESIDWAVELLEANTVKSIK